MTPTQLVNLWIANDENLYRCSMTLIHVSRSWWELEQGIRDLIEGELYVLTDDQPASVGTDLLNHAFNQVDFRDIAMDYWSEYREPLDYAYDKQEVSS